jgi:hypothetical protein
LEREHSTSGEPESCKKLSEATVYNTKFYVIRQNQTPWDKCVAFYERDSRAESVRLDRRLCHIFVQVGGFLHNKTDILLTGNGVRHNLDIYPKFDWVVSEERI